MQSSAQGNQVMPEPAGVLLLGASAHNSCYAAIQAAVLQAHLRLCLHRQFCTG